MSQRKFLSWPPGWRRAVPWGVLVGGVVTGAAVVVQGVASGGNSLDLLFWCDLAVVVPVVVVGVTAVAGKRMADDPGSTPSSQRPTLSSGRIGMRVARSSFGAYPN